MKKKTKQKNDIVILLTLFFITIIIIAGTFLIYIYTQNYIKLEKVDNSAYEQEVKRDNEASPIYMNNLLIGGVSKNNWVSKKNIYEQQNKVKQEQIDIYDLSGKVGTYNITEINKEGKDNEIYINTDRITSRTEYIALPTSDKNISLGKTSILNSTDEDKKIVKKALGVYSFLNNTIKINEIYDVTMKNGENGKIICATSEGKNNLGIYSIAIYSTGKRADIIKYCYVKDSKRSVDWPIYSLKFVYDLNLDGVSEIVLQETNEYQIKYSVMEYRNNKFYEVLSHKLEL